jgi:hypothetical protein
MNLAYVVVFCSYKWFSYIPVPVTGTESTVEQAWGIDQMQHD